MKNPEKFLWFYSYFILFLYPKVVKYNIHILCLHLQILIYESILIWMQFDQSLHPDLISETEIVSFEM